MIHNFIGGGGGVILVASDYWGGHNSPTSPGNYAPA